MFPKNTSRPASLETHPLFHKLCHNQRLYKAHLLPIPVKNKKCSYQNKAFTLYFFFLLVVWREKYTHLLLSLLYYKPQMNSKPSRSQCCSVFNDEHAGALESLQSSQTDRKGEDKKQKHEDLRMVILRRQEFRSSELREEDASSPHSE